MSERCLVTVLLGVWLGVVPTLLAQSAIPPGARSDVSTGNLPQTVYVPWEELDRLLTDDEPGVLVSRDEFDRLLARSRAEASLEATHPEGVSAEYRGRIEADLLTLDAVLTGRYAGQEPGTWRLPLRGLAIESAVLNERPARMARDSAGDLLVQVPAAGTHRLQLKLSAPLRAHGGEQSALLGLPRFPVARVGLAIPAGKHLSWGDLTLQRPAPDEQACDYEFPLGGQGEVLLRIGDRVRSSRGQNVVLATTVLGLHVAAEEQSWRASTALEVHGRDVDQLVLEIPAEVELVGVESVGLDRWESTREGATQRLVLHWQQPFAGRRQITVQGVVPRSTPEPWTVPTLTIPEIAAHHVRVLVQADPSVRLRQVSASSIQRIANESWEKPQPGAAAGPDDAAVAAARPETPPWRFAAWSPGFSLVLETLARTRELSVTSATHLAIGAGGLVLEADLELLPRHGSLFDFEFRLPAEWSVQEIVHDGRSVAWTVPATEPGWNLLRVMFSPPIPDQKRTTLHVVATQSLGEDWPPGDEPVVVPLPVLEFPAVNVLLGRYLISSSQDLDLATEEFLGLEPVSLGAPVAEDGIATQGWEHQDSQYSGRLRLTRRPARLFARTLGVHRLGRDTLVSRWTIQILAQGAGARAIEIALPESTGTNLQFRVVAGEVPGGPMPRLESQSSAADGGGQRVWTLRFAHRVRGLVRLAVDLETPRPADLPAWEVPRLVVLGAERQFGQVGIEAENDQQLAVVATDSGGQPLRSIDAADLPDVKLRSVQRRIVEAFEMVRPGERIVVRETRFVPGSVPSAICTDWKLLSLLNTSGEFQHRVEVKLQAVGAQALLVRPRGDVELWGVQVDGTPVEIRRIQLDAADQEVFSIPLTAVDPPERERLLRIFYRNRGNLGAEPGTLRESPPELEILTGGGERLPVVTLHREWDLVLPPDWNVLNSTGDFRPRGVLPRSGTIDWIQQNLIPQGETRLRDRLLLLLAAVAFPWLVSRLWLLLRSLAGRIRGVRVQAWLWLLLLLVTLLLAGRAYFSTTLGPMAAKLDDSRWRDISKSERGVYPLPTASVQPMAAAPGGPSDDVEEHVERPQLWQKEAADRRPAAPAAQPAPRDGEAPVVVEGRDAAGEVGPGADPAKPVPAQPPRRPPLRGRLSLAMDLAVPPEAERIPLVQDGVLPDDQSPTLEVTLSAGAQRRAQRLIWLALTVLVFWLCRRQSPARKLLLGAAALGLPWALQTVVSPPLNPLLDGAFLGGCLGLLLWWVRFLAGGRVGDLWHRRMPMICLLVGGCWAGSVQGAEPAPRRVPPRFPVGRVIIPWDAARVSPPGDAGRAKLPSEPVLIPWSLHRKWSQPEGLRTRGDFPDQVSQIELRIVPEPGVGGARGRARVTSRMDIVTEGPGQTLVPLPIAQVTPLRVALDGEPAILVPGATGDAPRKLVVPQPGRHELQLDFDVPAEITQSEGQLGLSLAPVATGVARIRLPAKETQLEVRGAARGFRRETVGEEIWATVVWEQPGPLDLKWGPVLTREAGQAVLEIESTAAFSVDDLGATNLAQLRCLVRQGSLRELSLQLPEGWLVRGLSGPDVAGWELDETAQPRALRVALRRPLADSTTLDLDLLRPLVFAEVAVDVEVPAIVVPDAVRHTGLVGVFAPERWDVSAGVAEGAIQVDTDQFPAAETSLGKQLCPTSRPRPQRVYRFRQPTHHLAFQVTRDKPLARGVGEQLVEITSRRLSFDGLFTLNLPEPPGSSVSFQLPEGFQVTEVICEGAADFWISGGAVGQVGILHLEFAAPRSGRLETRIRGFVPRLLDDPVAIVTPLVPLEMNELKTTCALWVDSAFQVRVEDSTGWKVIDPESLAAPVFGSRKNSIRFGFQSETVDTTPLALLLDPAEVRVSAAALSQVLVRDTSVEQALFLRWKFPAAAARQVCFEVPDWLGSRLELESFDPRVRIRHVQREPVPLNRQRLTVELEEPQSNELLLGATASFAIPEEGRIAAPLVTFEQPVASETGRSYRQVDNQQAYVLLINQGWRRLSGPATEPLEVVSPEDLPFQLPQDLHRQTTGLWRVRDRRGVVEWQQEAATAVRSLGAVVNYAELRQTLTPDGSWRMVATYRVVNRSRQFLPLRLPPGAQVLSVFVQNTPSRPVDPARADEPGLVLIPLPLTPLGDRGSEVRVVLQGRLAKPLPIGWHLFRTELDLPAPAIVSTDEDPELGIPVTATEWTVWLPEEQSVERVEDPERTNVSESLRGLERVLTSQREWLDLFRKLGDSSLSDSARQRIEDNLSRFDERELQFDSTKFGESLPRDGYAREQLAEVSRQNEQLAEARRQLAGGKASGEEGLRPVNNRQLQTELYASNRGVVRESEVSSGTAGDFSKPTSGRALANSRVELNEQVERQTREQLTNRAKGFALPNQLGVGVTSNSEAQAATASERRDEVLLEQLEQDFGKQAIVNRRRTTSRAGSAAAGTGSPAGQVAEFQQGQAPLQGLPGWRVAAANNAPLAGGQPAGAGDEPAAAPRGRPDNADQRFGLSLPVDILEAGQKRTFHRSEGAPRLALSFRNRESTGLIGKLLWTVLWLAEGALLCWLMLGSGGWSVWRRVAWALTSVGVVWVLVCTPSVWGVLPLILGLALLLGVKEQPTVGDQNVATDRR
jgi:hypothetical protein